MIVHDTIGNMCRIVCSITELFFLWCAIFVYFLCFYLIGQANIVAKLIGA